MLNVDEPIISQIKLLVRYGFKIAAKGNKTFAPIEVSTTKIKIFATKMVSSLMLRKQWVME
jgi:hypothetical protein